MKHAYLIMAHNDFESLQYLLQAIDDERNDIYLHIDKKTSYVDYDEIRTWVKNAGLFFVPRINVRWGHSSFVKCELILLETATKNGKYKYYHLLSGIDYPLKSQDEIHSALEDKNLEYLNYHFEGDEGDEFAYKIRYYHPFMGLTGRGIFEGPGKKNELMRRITKKHWEVVEKQKLKGVDRRKKYPEIQFVKGDNWCSVTDDFARYVLSKKNKIMRMSHFVNTPDEFFMATLAYNSVFKDRIANDSLRLIDWQRGTPYEFVNTDLEELKQSEKFFARKISYVNEPELVRALAEYICVRNVPEKKAEPLVSIVVPIYNVENYLEECLDSLINQTYKNIEVLMVNDGSNDNSGDIAQQYSKKDSRFKYIYQENQGLSAARNTGIKESKGDYISVIDSDDWVEPDYVEAMLKVALDKDADITISGLTKELDTPQEICIHGDKVYSRTSAMHVLSNIYTEDYLEFIVAVDKLYKRKIFDKVQFQEGKLHEDEFAIHRIIDEANLICTVDKSLYHYRMRANSITSSEQSANLRHFDIVDAHRDRVKCCRKQIYSDFYRLIVYSLFEEIIWLMPTYNHEAYKNNGLNNRFRKIMVREYISNFSQLDKYQRKEYLSVILNPEGYRQNKD